MKKKCLTIMFMVVISVFVLTGCHMKHEWVEATCTEPRTCSVGGETEGEALGHAWVEATCTEPKTCNVCGVTEGEALGHEWQEATYDAPKTCALCKLTEGESLPKPCFLERGIICEEWKDMDIPIVMSFAENGELTEIDGLSIEYDTAHYTFGEITSEAAEQEGYINVIIPYEINFAYTIREDSSIHQGKFSWKYGYNELGLCDYYTGLIVDRDDSANNADVLGRKEITWDGNTYVVSIAQSSTEDTEVGNWVWDGNIGRQTRNVVRRYVVTVTIPEDYDGAVLRLYKNKNERLIEETRIAEGKDSYIFEESEPNDFIYVRLFEGSKASDATGAASGDTSDGAVIDDSREQGSIGESGLPYYKIGFSPKDFAIGGLSVYDGKTVDEMFDAVDLPDWADTNGSVEGWYKQHGANGATMFGLTEANGSASLVYYTNEPEEIEMRFSDTAGYTIAGADFIQSPFVPGETTFAEAVDALGIRDVITAMGIQGDAFKDAKLDFESQFGEDTHAYISWGDYNNLVVYWTDRDGKEVRLTLMGEGDVVDGLSISREN